MKLIITFMCLFTLSLNAQDANQSSLSDINASFVDTNITLETNTTQELDFNATLFVDTNLSDENASLDTNVTFDMNTTFEANISDENVTDENSTTQRELFEIPQGESLSKFEKAFVHHSAYNSYLKSIEYLLQNDYKNAYAHAMDAKKIYYKKDKDATIIPLPYMPSYLRESAYTPKKIYYKVLKHKSYELKRLITKIKLMSPPIASVILKRTSTYIDIIVRNYGDLPLDDFELLLNSQRVIMYEKILPNEEKTYRYSSAPKLYEISFKEEFGFAPNSIMLNEGY